MAEPAPSSTPPSVPGYELLRCIGRGSYGEVWLARDGSGGFRAVKIVYRKTFEHDRPFERELSGIQKFEPISRSHPSQVSILQVGRNVAEGYFYYVMELADDASAPLSPTRHSALSPASYVPRTLKSELTRRERLSFRECLDISLALAKALDHLHQHGLIHRDIKPSNVIFAQGVPKLADIGLVTDVGASISFVGTEGFLPPEGPGTPQGDLYSLGKVLYEISTGHDRMDFPELPTFVDDAGEKEHLLELNQVFLKACQNDPRRRYQSAREMSADLALLHSGKSLRRARAVGQRLAQVRLLVGTVILSVVAASLANYLIQQQRIRRVERESAFHARAEQKAQEFAAGQTRRLADGYAVSAKALESEGDYAGALLWLAKALNEENADPARTDLRRQRLASLRQRIPPMPALIAHAGAVRTAAFSQDGRRIVTASDDTTARVWDAESGEPLSPPLEHSNRVIRAELSPDGERALTLDDNGVAQLWIQLGSTPASTKLAHDGRFTFIAFSPNGRQLVAVTDSHEAQLWETSSRRLRFTLKHRARILCAMFSGDGRFVATGSADQSARIWDTETGEPLTPALAHESPVTQISFSPDGRRLATVGEARARVWSTRSGDPALFVLRHDAAISTVSFSPDGKQLLTAGEDMTARVWDAITGKPLAPPLYHSDAIRRAVFSPDGRLFATASGDRVQVWSARTFEMIPPIFVHNAAVRAVQFSPAGHLLLTASADGTARVFAVDANPNTPSSSRAAGMLSSSGAEISDRHASAPENGRTPGDWMEWAQLGSGRQISTNEQVAPIPAESLRKLWTEWRKKSPHSFEASPRPAWHRVAAEVCEKSEGWFGAEFHWKQALALRPTEERFRAGREHAARELARMEQAAARGEELPRRIPSRPADAGAQLLDLSAHYNAALTESWLPTSGMASGNDLSALQPGLRRFGGVEFDVRGIVQLSGGALENSGGRFPREVSGIQAGSRCRKIHFLHGAAWSARAGTHVGSYFVHYAGGDSREIKIIFGQNVREWLSPPAPQLITGAAVAWEGSNPAARALGLSVRLYQMTWSNSLPDVEVRSIEFKSTMENPAPFLIAITTQ